MARIAKYLVRHPVICNYGVIDNFIHTFMNKDNISHVAIKMKVYIEFIS